MKENDIVLNMLANPEFTPTDFLSVGLTGNNTGLRSEEEYLQSDKIRNNEYFISPDTGKFDEARFHSFYLGAGLFYNLLATQDYELSAIDQAVFSKDNMWVSPDKRVVDFQPKLVRQENEHLVTSSLESIGKRGLRTLSQSEIAQTQKVYNVETGEWTDSPNDSFFDNLTEPLVLATYDEDEYDDNGNLIHQKGERKLNEEGLPYYETLGGRDVYGKQVLNKFNLITTDGSAANQFDFFDTDDLEQKSIGGTIMRNAALVGSMFIPYIGPWVAGLSIATQTAGLLATLGKLVVGNEDKTLNTILGWAKSVNRSGLTEYAAQNTWCVENFLNMIGDTVGQLKEQRWIFQTLPGLLGHTKAMKALSGEKGYNSVVDEVVEQMSKSGAAKTTKDLLKNLKTDGFTQSNLAELELIAANFAKQNKDKAIKYVDDLIKQANNIGAPISKAYMTALTVQDTYGEARAAGASHIEAVALTLGYAAGEVAILNSEIGSWILPEIQELKLKHKAIAKALSQDVKDAYGELAKDGSKKNFIQKLFNIGGDVAKKNYAEIALTGTKTLGLLGNHAMSEAIEEVSEELLNDFSKQVFNTVRWLRGEEALELGEWDNMFDRYAMSAAGGFLGGGIASAGTTFKQARDLASMDKSKAMQEILYMVNNGKEGEFLKSLNTMDLGNKNLSASKIIGKTENGEVIYGEGTDKDNLDAEIKKVVTSYVKKIKDILESEGAKVSTKSLLNRLTLEDLKDVMKQLRFSNLQTAKSMGLYLQDFLNIQADIVKTKSELLSLNDSPDSAEELITVSDRRSKLEEKLKELRIKKDAYTSGKMAPDAIRDAIFEMNPIISAFLTKTNLKLYAEAKLNKKWSSLSDKEKEDITKEYKDYSETSMKNDIHTGASILQNMIELFSPFARRAQEYAENVKQKQGQAYDRLNKHITEIFSYRLPENVDSDEYLIQVLDKLQTLDVEFAGLMGKDFFSVDTKRKLNDIISDTTLDSKVKAKIYINTLFDNLSDNLESNIQEFIDIEYIHPEVKNSVLSTLKTAKETLLTHVLNYDPDDPSSITYEIEHDDSIDPLDKYDAENSKRDELLLKIDKIDESIKKIEKLSNTPILEYLDLFQTSTTHSDLKLSKHLAKVTDLLNDATLNSSLDEMLVDELFLEDNEEALLLLDSFISVINSMKVDNADINNPTGYSKMLNEVYKRQGVKDYVDLTELNSDVADIMIQDALLIRQKLEFVLDIHDINKGQKLKQHDKVNTNKNFLLYNTLQTRFVDVIPDEWVGDDKGTSAKQVLQNVLNSVVELKKIKPDNLKLPKETRTIVEEELTTIANTIYDIFQRPENKVGDSWDPKKLQQILKNFSKMGGFFLKTGGVLNDSTKYLDDNSFIWWLASKAILRQSDFDTVYMNSLTPELAPIPSQELAVQLGVSAIVNMNGLNAFVDAYRDTVIKEFNSLSVSDRETLLKNFDENSTGFADKLFKYFASYDAIPQYHNMVFIEGIPGSGKSGGVFKSIKAVMDQIDPDWLKNVAYAHVTKKSAEDAGKKIGFEGATYYDKEDLMKWMSPEWKDIKSNPSNKDGKLYLYKDSYEFDTNGKLLNKWKVNKITNAPKVLFIDEISHYNLQELSLIEQFAKVNGIVVLTAGDLDQDTQTAYLMDGKEELNVTINRNNFIRSPKLGLSLRSLNKLMTHDVIMMLASMQQIKDKKPINELRFTYLEDDPKHKGLFGVKTASTLNEDTKKTILTMVDTATDKIGYIYHDENSELYKYLNTHFKDKINFYKDSEAQGLEGLYYIVENDLKVTGPTVDDARSYQYMRSLYTGISRAELGVLAIVPSNSFGLIQAVTSVKDPTYLLEPLGKSAIEKSSKNRKELLEHLSNKFKGNPIKIIEPSSTTTTTASVAPTGGLPPSIPPSTPPVTKIDYGYINESEAQTIVDDFKSIIDGMTNPKAIENSTGNSYDFVEFKNVKGTAASGETVYTPTVVLTDGSGSNIELAIEEFNTKYGIKDDSGTIANIYNKDDKLVINEGGSNTDIVIVDFEYPSGAVEPEYTITNLDGSNSRKISQSELQSKFIEYWTKPPSIPTEGVIPDNGLENNPEVLGLSITESNETEETRESGPHISHRIYTFNGFQPGIKLKDGRIIYPDNYNQRVDNGIPLLKIRLHAMPSESDEDAYNAVIKTLGLIKQRLYHEEDNGQLLEYLLDVLGLSGGNYSLVYAIKSSSPSMSENYELYYSEDEELEYIYSDDPDAKNTPRKKLVLLVKDGKDTKFELTIGSLNSPLTLILEKDSDNKYVYPTIGSKFKKLVDSGLTVDSVLDTIVNLYDGKSSITTEEQDLINLIKLFKFTSNGIFYFGNLNKDGKFKPSNFNLAKCKSSGPQLIKKRGKHLLNGGLQYNGGFISLEEFASNPQFNVSSIMVSKSHEDKVYAGYPFVLVSTNPDIITDDDLIQEFNNDNPDVRMYYVLPPRAKVSEWLTSQHNNYEEIVRSGGSTRVLSLIGNQFTAYRVLDAIIKAGEIDSLNSVDSIKEDVVKAILDLNDIAQKWTSPDIPFSGKMLIGTKTDKDLYEEYLDLYKDRPDPEHDARERLILLEQRNYLELKNNWGKVPLTNDISILDALNYYLRNMVWKSFPPGSTVVTSENLEKIDRICKSQGLTEILYKTFIGGDVGSNYAKIVTTTKYGITKADGTIGNFEINAKIDPPSFGSDILWLEISKITAASNEWNSTSPGGMVHRTQYFYYNPHDKTWKLTDRGRKFEEDYLSKESLLNPSASIKSSIISKYKSHFDSGLLNESVIDESADEITNLKNLASDYNRIPGHYGFVHNGILYLTEFDSNVTIFSIPTTLEPELIGKDTSGNEYKFEISATVDSRGFISSLNVTRTTYSSYDINSEELQVDISQTEFDDLRNEINNKNRSVRIPALKIGKYLESIDSLDKLRDFIVQASTSYNSASLTFTYNGKLFSIVNIESDLTKLSNPDILTKILNYIKNDGNIEKNKYNIIVKIGDLRMLLLNESQAQIINSSDSDLFPTELISGREIIDLTDSQKNEMKLETVECSSITWNIKR